MSAALARKCRAWKTVLLTEASWQKDFKWHLLQLRCSVLMQFPFPWCSVQNSLYRGVKDVVHQ